DIRSVQPLSHFVRPVLQSGGASLVQPPSTHLPVTHALPHSPQLSGSVLKSMHTPSQSACETPSHGPSPQPPLMHSAPWQALLHSPQWSTLVDRSTILSPH